VLSHVLLTHHHWDHVDGLPKLLEFHSPQIIGSAADLKRLPPLHLPVSENDKIQIGGNEGTVFDTPGHTIGHISVYFEASKLLFSADTLMALGCGRLFEGTAEQMWHSLQKLSKLPDDTLVCSGHEYTEKNADFALTIDPKNQELVNRVQFTKKIRAEGVPTVPSNLGEEKKTNPFLRPWNKNIRTKIGMLDATDEEVFGKIRALKDAY
jgi:hydroxyacylglutathione hydrolase